MYVNNIIKCYVRNEINVYFMILKIYNALILIQLINNIIIRKILNLWLKAPKGATTVN